MDDPLRLEFVGLLRCQGCRGHLQPDRHGSGATLVCANCGRSVTVRAGIPRFIDAAPDRLAQRTQASFGYEWTEFHDWRDSGERNFREYFQGLDNQAVADRLVLDAGCGMGRHAREMARTARLVAAVDFSAAIDMAARNVRDCHNVHCVQADLLDLPFEDDAFDYVYSIGVLHHIPDTLGALAGLVRKVRPGGRVRVYLYWKRHGWSGALLHAVEAVRRVTTRMPFALLKACCWLLSVALFFGLVLPYRALDRLGVRAHTGFPLYLYARYPFRVLYNDQFDRFSAPLEQRFDEHEVRSLMESAGLREVRTFAHFGWIAEGVR